MSTTNVAIVKKMVDAFNAGDVNGALAIMHPDVILNEADSLPYPGITVGHEGFKGFLGKLRALFDVTTHDSRLYGAEDKVIIRIDITFKSRSSGRSVSMPVVEIYTLTNDKITHIDVFYKDAKAIHDLAAE